MTGECRLISGVGGAIAQLCLLAAAILSLLIKRWRERPQRPLTVWGLDVSKQVFAAGAAHVCGMLIAMLVSERSGGSSQCAWYFVVFTLDTTLGVTISVGLHTGLVQYAKRKSRRRAQIQEALNGLPQLQVEPRCLNVDEVYDAVGNCGSYGVPPSLRKWAYQMLEWAVAVVLARVLCGSLIYLLRTPLQKFAAVIDAPFGGKPTAELYFVMVMCPLTMNLIQLCVQDQVLKWRKRS